MRTPETPPHSRGPPHFGGALGTPRGTAQPEAVKRLGAVGRELQLERYISRPRKCAGRRTAPARFEYEFYRPKAEGLPGTSLSAGRRRATLIRQAAPSPRAKATIGAMRGAWRVAVVWVLSCMGSEHAHCLRNAQSLSTGRVRHAWRRKPPPFPHPNHPAPGDSSDSGWVPVIMADLSLNAPYLQTAGIPARALVRPQNTGRNP